jgi:hypothetical protein
LCGLGCNAAATSKISVTTYHYNNLRTGWNDRETLLSQASVSGGTFNLRASVALDDQVDVQPLIVEDQAITGQGTHDVLYLATENNTVYAIDASSGRILLHPNFGPPVPYTSLPGSCRENGPNVGISSTPVIDLASGTLYVVAYTMESGKPVYRIHALDLASLTDKAPSAVIAATGKLADGSTYDFDASVSRQRAALLLANGDIYASFSSFCDSAADRSRGWLLGWQTGTLTPLMGNRLNNTRAFALHNFYLSSIWMSGYGPAASLAGDIYFVTGNSDPSGTTYNAQTNLSESVIELSSDLTKVESYFSPTGSGQGVKYLDQHDEDFGSGGIMLLPEQPGTTPNLAVAAGKAGFLYLLDADNLGARKALGAYQIGGCWCGESYFVGSDGTRRIVASGGNKATIWKVQTSATSAPTLVEVASSPAIANGQRGGFLTSVSSSGTTSGSAVIWAASRPTDNNPAHVSLYAFDADNGSTLFTAVAGSWPNTTGNANIMPVVANGKVYVAADQSLAIFGLGTGQAAALPRVATVDMRVPLAPGQHEFSGIVRKIDGARILVQRRNGILVTIDATLAVKNFQFAAPGVGHAVLARGSFDEKGVMHVDTLQHAKDNPALWQPDR